MAENKRSQQMKEITQKLEKGVKEIFTSEMYKEYLKTMSQFHDYSLNNTLLIYMQKPDASLVAGYQAWQKKFKRQVKRGEKGIQIIAPAPIREKEEVEKLDPETQEPILKPDGTPEMEEVVYTIPRFRIATVFDVSQTEGEPLPGLEVPELTGNVKNYETFLQALKEVSPVPIRFDEIESGAKGYYSNTKKEIVIQKGMSESQTMKTGIHETAHAKLHDRDFMEETGEKKDQMTREVEAESVAYTVCQYFGLDTSEYSFPYIAGWSSDKDLKELRASMDTIRKTAGEFINQMTEKIQEIQWEEHRHTESVLFTDLQDRYGIYQLSEEGNGREYRFMNLAYLKGTGLAVEGKDYQFVYGDVLREGDTLEDLYEKFNIDHPGDYTGYSLSVSDVVVLKQGNKLTAHYVDSFGYEELPDFIRQREELLEEKPKQKEYPPLYVSDLEYAIAHKNADAYLDSRKQNLDCKNAIEEAIRTHFDGYHLAQDAAKGVLERYGEERITYILACTVQHLERDGRFSRDTKEWAAKYLIPKNDNRGIDSNQDYVVTSHPAVLDGFIGLAREEIQERKQEVQREKVQVTEETKGLLVDGHFGTWHTAEARKISGKMFYRMEHDEYGNTVAGIIVDEKGKLAAEDLEHGFDEGAMEAIEEYLQEEQPEPFLKQFYVVNDAYGIQEEPKYQYFEVLEEALEAYRRIPNHLEKQLVMESREAATSRMPLLTCVNGTDNIEDIERNSLSGKWFNQEVQAVLEQAEKYLEEWDTEAAYQIPSTKQYFFIQTTEEGYDYTFYDQNFRDLDGGVYENPNISMKDAMEEILEEEGIESTTCKVIDCAKFQEKVEQAEHLTPTSERDQKEQALNGQSRQEIEETVLCYAQAKLEEMGLEDEVQIKAARVYGSRTRDGLYQDSSDLDVVLSYQGNIREDDFFTALHEDGMKIAGLPVDVNPISEEKTGTLEAYLEQAERYLDEKVQELPEQAVQEPENIPENPSKEAKISFYVAECMELPVLGEYQDNLTLKEAFERYQAIPAERLHGVKGIGFRLEDGSIYTGEYELMRAGSISKDMIDLVPHYKESPLVQKAVADLEEMLSKEQLREAAAERMEGTTEQIGEVPSEKPETGKPMSTKQSVLQALQERQEKIKAKEQTAGQKSQEKKKGEPEL